MNILGPFPMSKKGNKYIIVAVDYVTKWAEEVALPVAGAAEVADFFVHEILLRHGAPRSLTTDQGKLSFHGLLFQSIGERFFLIPSG